MKKSILITGASRGLGIELLKVYLNNDWKTFPVVRNFDPIKNIARQHPNSCFPIIGDVTDPLIKKEIINTLKQNTTSLDILINNAGNVKKVLGIDNVTEEDIDSHLQVHCVGTFRIIKSCLPFLRNSENAKIININSRRGSLHDTNNGKYPSLYPYQIAKSAQNMLTVCLNNELKNEGIKVFALHPGRLKTESAPPDADTKPDYAAEKIFRWINQSDNKSVNLFYDVIEDSIINW